MQRSAPEPDRESRSAGGPWAKSGGPHRPRHSPPFFRHELASALALLGDGKGALRGVAEPDLVVYLVAAHHGRIRLGIRSVPEEERTGRVLGTTDGDSMPAVQIPGGEMPPSRLSLAPVQLGRGADGALSWAGRALALLEREDLGPSAFPTLKQSCALPTGVPARQRRRGHDRECAPFGGLPSGAARLLTSRPLVCCDWWPSRQIGVPLGWWAPDGFVLKACTLDDDALARFFLDAYPAQSDTEPLELQQRLRTRGRWRAARHRVPGPGSTAAALPRSHQGRP